MRITGELLVVGAVLRLTRLIVTDDVGKWWVREPLYDAARTATNDALSRVDKYGHCPGTERSLRRAQWLNRLDDGVRCSFCVGYWIGALVLLSYLVAGRTRLWRFVAGSLTLNYLTAHIGSRLGDVNDPEEHDE